MYHLNKVVWQNTDPNGTLFTLEKKRLFGDDMNWNRIEEGNKNLHGKS